MGLRRLIGVVCLEEQEAFFSYVKEAFTLWKRLMELAALLIASATTL